MLEGRSTASAERRAEGLTEWGFPRDEESIASAYARTCHASRVSTSSGPFFTPLVTHSHLPAAQRLGLAEAKAYFLIRKHDHFTPTREIRRHVIASANARTCQPFYSFYSFYLKRISVFCQPIPLPSGSGFENFAYLHTRIGVDMVHRRACQKGPLPNVQKLG